MSASAQAFAGKYRLIEALGGGSMGRVYRALDAGLGRELALKMINRGALGVSPGVLTARFHIEAQAAAQLAHPGIVTVFDYGEETCGPYIAMEYLSGGRLDQYIERRGTLNLGDAMCLMLQLLAALNYAHERGVIHQDIKPSNLMLSSQGALKITDFGLARVAWLNSPEGAQGRFGTPRYMAPEQYSGSGAGPGVDIHAAGAVLYELLAGAPAFTGSLPELMYRICHEPPPPLLCLPAPVRTAFEPVLLRALAKQPQARYRCAGDFAAALQEAWRGVRGLATVPPRLSVAGRAAASNPQTVLLPQAGGTLETEWEMQGEAPCAGLRALGPAPGRSARTEIPGTAPAEEDLNFAAHLLPPGPQSGFLYRRAWREAVQQDRPQDPSRGGLSHWPAAQLAPIERALCQIVGPVAVVLVRRAARRAQSLAELHQCVADALASPQEQARYARLIGAAALCINPMEQATGAQVRTAAVLRKLDATTLTGAHIERAESLLAQQLGPIARVLCAQAAMRAVTQGDFYRLLTARLRDSAAHECLLKVLIG